MKFLSLFNWISMIYVFYCFTAISEANNSSQTYDTDTQRIVIEWKFEEANKEIVRTFLQGLLGDKDLSVIDKYVDPQIYIQHSASLGDGGEALKALIRQRFPLGLPKTKIEFLKIGADGDLVYIHTKSTRNNNPASVVHIFKLKKGKLIEHWEVAEEVTPEALAASKNDHPFF